MSVSADYIPISALQHYQYCPRQCALIHLEQIWVENVHTAEGRQLHEKAHGGSAESRGERKIVTALQLCSEQLGIAGEADVVEFHRYGEHWQPYPVEYKRGSAKHPEADKIQLCAQALCLEEMLHVDIPEGALFYGKIRRRVPVQFDCSLREHTGKTIEAVRKLLQQGQTPPPPSGKEAAALCPACSLRDVCLPLVARKSAAGYLQAVLETV